MSKTDTPVDTEGSDGHNPQESPGSRDTDGGGATQQGMSYREAKYQAASSRREGSNRDARAMFDTASKQWCVK